MLVTKKPMPRSGWWQRALVLTRRRWRDLDRLLEVRSKLRLLREENSDLRAQADRLREIIDSLQYENQLRGMIAQAEQQSLSKAVHTPR